VSRFLLEDHKYIGTDVDRNCIAWCYQRCGSLSV